MTHFPYCTDLRVCARVKWLHYWDRVTCVTRVTGIRRHTRPTTFKRNFHDDNRAQTSAFEATAIVLEARSCLGNAGINATTAEVIDLVRLVALREADPASTARPGESPRFQIQLRGSILTNMFFRVVRAR